MASPAIMKISDDKLHGRVVLSGDGIAIGDVSRLMIEGAQFTIASIEIKLRREIAEKLGMERSRWHGATVEIPASAVRSVGDAVLLSLNLDQLRAASLTGVGEPAAKRPAEATKRPDVTQGGLVEARDTQPATTPVRAEERAVDVREQTRPQPPR